MKNNSNNKGFTLIEVLIALMILAIALTAVILASQNSIRNANHIKDKLAAHWVAMNVISRMQVGRLASPTNGNLSRGEAHMLGKTFEWMAGVDQKNNGYYKRIYINVSEKASSIKLEHLIGFINTRVNKKDEIVSK